MGVQISFTNFSSVSSNRIIYTPSNFARSSLIHLQETGTLEASHPHKSERTGLGSCLFFTVLEGDGLLTYDGKIYELEKGDCVFIDCKKAYSHETPLMQSGQASQLSQALIHSQPSKNLIYGECGNVGCAVDERGDNESVGKCVDGLWSLQWCHFYGPNMNAIYRKYMERGGQPVFLTQKLSEYQAILDTLYNIASSDDYVRDMRIHEKLSSLLILLMEDAWNNPLDRGISTRKAQKLDGSTEDGGLVDIQEVKEYLDSNYLQRLTIDDLASRFYINKYYLMTLFKERYGVTVNAYLNQVRVTYIKQQLRFTDKTVEMLAIELDIEPTYLSRLFKKIEGIPPSEYRKQWSSIRDKDET